MTALVVRIVLCAALLGLSPCTVAAHPHMFFSSTAQFLTDAEGRLTGLRTVFLVDELNTLYSLTELGVNNDGDQTLDEQERDKIAESVVGGFGHYNFFTKLSNELGQIALDQPTEVTVNLVKGRLGLSFLMPLKQPQELKGKTLSLQLYDPTYFTAISIDRPPMVVGNNAICSVSVSKPSDTDDTLQTQQYLSELSREETPEEEDIGAIFAEKTVLRCQH